MDQNVFFWHPLIFRSSLLCLFCILFIVSHGRSVSLGAQVGPEVYMSQRYGTRSVRKPKHCAKGQRQGWVTNSLHASEQISNGYGSIPIDTIFRGYFDVHQGYKVLTHCQMGAARLINVIGVVAITYNRLTPTLAISGTEVQSRLMYGRQCLH